MIKLLNLKKRSIPYALEKSSQWKGDKVTYNSLHFWIRRNTKRPSFCSLCKKKCKPDLANIGEKYTRNPKDWEWLCRSCHMKKDGRWEQLQAGRKRLAEASKIKNTKLCLYCKKQFVARNKNQKNCSIKCGSLQGAKTYKKLYAT